MQTKNTAAEACWLLFSCSFFVSIATSSFAQTDALPQAENCTEYPLVLADIAKRKESRVDVNRFASMEGKTIRHIDFKTVNVFDTEDPNENNGLFRLLNSVHVTTRQKVIRGQLLFKEGDKIDPDLMSETGRNLRQRKYLTNAYVLPVRECGDQVDVLVVTRDAWALEPQFSFSKKSTDKQTGVGINDGNVFGTGNALSITYKENSQRNLVSYDFSNPHLLNKPIAVQLTYQDTSDGRNIFADVSHPFYSLESPWTAGFLIADISQVETIRSRGKIINEFNHQAIDDEIYWGEAFSVTDNTTQRVLVGFAKEEDNFQTIDASKQAVPLQDKASYPWLEYQYLTNKFGVYKNINQIQRPEDIQLGHALVARIGFAGTNFGNPDDVLRYKATYDFTKDIAQKHIVQYELGVDGKQHLQTTGLDPAILSAAVSYHYFQDEKNRWYARMAYDIGQHLPQHKELTLGDVTGLRGYPTDYVRGDTRYVFTLERRYFTDLYLFNILRVGLVGFVDVGRAWGLNSDPNPPVLSDVGFGLRLSSTKVRVGNVIHFDIATPTSARNQPDVSKYQILIGASQKF